MKTPDEIRLARHRIGYSQMNMADEMGISQPAYSKIENGKRKEIPPHLWKKMEHVFNSKKGIKTTYTYEEKITELEGDVYFLKKELEALKKLFFKLIKPEKRKTKNEKRKTNKTIIYRSKKRHQFHGVFFFVFFILHKYENKQTEPPFYIFIKSCFLFF